MSATIEAQMFANYFSSRINGVPQPAPRLFVEGRTHAVLEYYLDDIPHVGTVSVRSVLGVSVKCVSCDPPPLPPV